MENINDTAFLAIFLQQIISSELLAEKGFQKKLQLTATSVQTNTLRKNAYIAISFLKSFVEEKAELLKTQEENKALVSLKPQKVKRLYVDGCFDLMHSGHFNAIRQVIHYFYYNPLTLIKTNFLSFRQSNTAKHLWLESQQQRRLPSAKGLLFSLMKNELESVDYFIFFP